MKEASLSHLNIWTSSLEFHQKAQPIVRNKRRIEVKCNCVVRKCAFLALHLSDKLQPINPFGELNRMAFYKRWYLVLGSIHIRIQMIIEPTSAKTPNLVALIFLVYVRKKKKKHVHLFIVFYSFCNVSLQLLRRYYIGKNRKILDFVFLEFKSHLLLSLEMTSVLDVTFWTSIYDLNTYCKLRNF